MTILAKKGFFFHRFRARVTIDNKSIMGIILACSSIGKNSLYKISSLKILRRFLISSLVRTDLKTLLRAQVIVSLSKILISASYIGSTFGRGNRPIDPNFMIQGSWFSKGITIDLFSIQTISNSLRSIPL